MNVPAHIDIAVARLRAYWKDRPAYRQLFDRALLMLVSLGSLASICAAQSLLKTGDTTVADSPEYSLFVQTSHGGHYLRKVLLDHHGQQLATLATDGEIKIWNLLSKQEVWSFRNVLGVTNICCSPLAFSPDDEQLAVGGDNGVIHVLSLTTGASHDLIEGGQWPLPLTSLAFSPDGETLAIGWMVGKVSVVTLSTGENVVLSDPQPPSNQQIRQDMEQGKMLPYISSLFFVDSSRKLLAALSTGKVDTFRLSDRQLEATLNLDGIIVQFGMSQGKVIAGGTDAARTSLRLWNLDTKTTIVDRHPCFIEGDIDYISVSEHGGLATTRCGQAESGAVAYEIWQLPDGQPTGLPTSLSGRTINGPSAVSADGTLIAVSDTQKAVSILSVDGLNPAEPMEQSPIDSVDNIQSIPDTGELVVGTADEVAIWKTVPTTQVQLMHANRGHAAFSADGKWIAYFDNTGKLLLVDRQLNKVIQTPITEPKIINNFTYRLVMSSAGPTVVWITGGGFGGYAKYWKNGEERVHILCQSDHQGELAVSSKGSYVAVGCNHYGYLQYSSSEVLLYRARNMALVDTTYGDLRNGDFILPTQSTVGGLAFSADETLYAASFTAAIQIRPTSGKGKTVSIPNDFEHHKTFFGPLALSDDNAYVATPEVNIPLGGAGSAQAGFSEQIALVSVSNGHVVMRSPLDAFCTGIVFFRHLLAVGLTDGGTILYRTPTLKPEVTLLHPDGWLAVTPDGWFDGNAEALHWVGWRVRHQKTIVPLDFLYDTYYLPNILTDIVSGTYARPSKTIGEELGIGSLQLMVEQGYIHTERTPDGSYLCFSSRPTTTVDVYSDGAPISFASNAIERGVTGICPWRARLPKGVAKVESAVSAGAREQHCPKGHQIDSRRQSEPGVLRVLTVAVGDYATSGSLYPALPSSVPSAVALEAFFNTQPRGAHELFQDIVVSPGLRSGVVPPTLANIRESLRKLAVSATANDTVFLFFSGHGIIPPGNQMFYFAPLGFESTSLAAIRRTGLNVPMIADLLREIPARRVVLIIDACQSGAALTSLAKITQLKAANEMRRNSRLPLGIYLLASATALQTATALPDDRVGPLAQIIIELAKGKKRGTAAVLSAGDILDTVCSDLPNATGQTPLVFYGGKDFPLINREH